MTIETTEAWALWKIKSTSWDSDPIAWLLEQADLRGRCLVNSQRQNSQAQALLTLNTACK